MEISSGNPLPIGIKIFPEGINFSLVARHATAVALILFTQLHEVLEKIELDPEKHRSGDIWHIFIKNLRSGQLYGYLIDGPFVPEEGQRYNPHKLLLDPYAPSVVGDYHFEKAEMYSYEKYAQRGDLVMNTRANCLMAPKSVAADPPLFLGGKRKHQRQSLSDQIIYEVHLKGFTAHESSQIDHPGTYLGLIEKLPHLRELGVTAIELMPIQEFNPWEIIRYNPTSHERLKQYWGYSTLNFFAPAQHYATVSGKQIEECRSMIQACHQEGINVFLDVVYNHTGEGNELGPTLSYRGIDNSVYYMLAENKRYYKNYSGCGNTFNCNMPIVKQLILDSLRFWHCHMGIDGFRFDLAAILGRNPKGEWIGENSILNDIINDPLLSNCKLIAEGWDAGGLYKLGDFPVGWAEWNGKYRDAVRRFLKGDDHSIQDFIQAFIGSPDLYSRFKTPDHSINYITSHDGFTLRDLVSYNSKHNFENGENNQDGMNDNHSYNWGWEGETPDSCINRQRKQSVKNFIAMLMLSQGVPMLYAGDEMYRTQKGNNNAYCQDVPWNWINWSNKETHPEIFNFTCQMIEFRKKHPILRRPTFFKNNLYYLSSVEEAWSIDISYHGTVLNNPDLADYSHSIAFLINGDSNISGLNEADESMFIIVNAFHEALTFEIPTPVLTKKWYLKINTAELFPHDFKQEGELWTQPHIRVAARSLVVLITG